jgi:hypothetical protein
MADMDVVARVAGGPEALKGEMGVVARVAGGPKVLNG